MTEDEVHDDSKPDCIGCMTRWEAVATTTHAVDDMHQFGDRVVEIGWA